MQLINLPEMIYVCRDCNFIHTSQYEIDKCPYCRSDDWVEYEPIIYEEEEE